MTQALERSSNIGAASVAQKLGADRFQRYVSAFGFGSRTGIDLQGEETGIVKRTGTPGWSQIDLITNAFGQGIAVTPIQMAVAMSAVANGGIMMRPYVVAKAVDPATGKVVSTTRPQIIRQAISRDASTTMLQMLFRSAENGETRGTLVPGFRAAGKTGTASIPTNGVYSDDETIASFVGAVPANDPQFVILVKIDRPRVEPWGSLVAKPTFAVIGQEVSRYLRLPRTEAIPPSVATAEAQAMARYLVTPTETAEATRAPVSTAVSRLGTTSIRPAAPSTIVRPPARPVTDQVITGEVANQAPNSATVARGAPNIAGNGPSPVPTNSARRIGEDVSGRTPTPTSVLSTPMPRIPSPTANFDQLRATATALARGSTR
jgi:membrane peptidoglycan carboxypeptidase